MIIQLAFCLEFHLQCLISIVPVIYIYQISPSESHHEPLVAWRQELLFTFYRWVRDHRKKTCFDLPKRVSESGERMSPQSVLERSDFSVNKLDFLHVAYLNTSTSSIL